MFRGINRNGNDLNIKIELWKNKNEILAEIPLEWCKEILYTFGEPTQLNLEIPKFIMRNNEKVINSLFNKIKIRQQLVVEIDGEKERFIITEQSFKLEKKRGTKSLTAYSFEKTLENKRISFLDTVTRTLVKDELYVHDGLLDEVAKASGWSIGYIDEDAKMITEMCNENVHVNLFENYTNNKVEEEGLIWEKDIITDVEDKYAVNIQIDYLNLKTYDENEKLLKTEQLSNQLKPLYTNIKNIKAYHHSETGNRYGIKYIITLADNVEVEQIHTFTNIVNKKIIAENINLIYETGKIIEGTRAKFISVEATNDNILNFMNVLQEQFNCVFEYDTMNKVINCYSKDNIGEDKPIELNYDTNVLSIDIVPSEIIPNCLEVEGNDGLSISSENPYGGNKIYNYSYYIENDYLPEETVIALDKYDKLLITKQQEYNTLKNTISDLQSAKTKYDSQISSLEYRIKYYYNLLTSFISVGESNPQQKQIRNEITELETKLNQCIRDRNSLQEQILSIEDDMVKISEEIQRDKAIDISGNKIFTDNDLEVLDEIEYCEIYEDSYYSTPYGLYNNSIKKLENMIKPEVEFNISCANLVKILKNKLMNVVELGSFFMVDTDELDELKEEKVRFIGYKLIPSENKIDNLVFSNKEFKQDNLSFASNVGKKATKSSNTLKTFRDVWEESKLSNNYIAELIEGGLNLATTQINSKSSSNLLDFSEYGSFWKDSANPTDGNQVYIGNSLIAISTNGFKTSEIALTGDGIIAKVIIGQLILGNRLEITSDTGQFKIGNMDVDEGFGLEVLDDSLSQRIFLGTEMVNGVRKARLRLYGKDGKALVLSEDGLISHNTLVFADDLDNTHPMEFDYVIQDGTQEIRECKLILALKPYRMTVKSIAGGGNSNTTISGGGTTSQNGGGYSETFTSGEVLDTSMQALPVTDVESASTVYGHYHTIQRWQFAHVHKTLVSIPAHYHVIKSHSHTLDWSHNHELEAGIFESTTPSNCSVYINDRLIASNIEIDTSIEVSEYLKVGINKIKITSTRLGRIQSTIYSKSFVSH